jgi:Lrp/AsnC family leucine-responsive transcriptional regulator
MFLKASHWADICSAMSHSLDTLDVPVTGAGRTLDDTDRQIVAFLQRDARMANAEIARRLGMAPSAIFDRIRKLEERHIIDGYEARLNAKAVGLGLTAFIFVRGEDTAGDPKIGALLAKIPEAQEIHHVAGEDCYLMKVRVADTDALGTLLRERIGAIKSVRSTRTTIALGTLKETYRLPVGEIEGELRR